MNMNMNLAIKKKKKKNLISLSSFKIQYVFRSTQTVFGYKYSTRTIQRDQIVKTSQFLFFWSIPIVPNVHSSEN